MKRNNKKGFTIVELVIVIAVIAILAAVMIPTFGTIVEDANKTAAEANARSGFESSYAQDLLDGVVNGKNGDTTLTATDANADGYHWDATNGPSYKATVNGQTHTYTLGN